MEGLQQRRARAWRRALVVSVALLPTQLFTFLVAQPVHAQNVVDDPIAQRVEKLAADAAISYHGADYARAVSLLEQAYKLRQMGVLLYNLAKAYDKLGDQEKAIELYRRYSASSDADVSLRARADARIAAYEDTQRRPRFPFGRKPPEVVKPPPPKETAEQRAVRLWGERRRSDRRTGIALMTTGGVSLLAAVGLSAAAFSLHKTYDETIGPEDQRRSARDRARAFAISSDVFYGVAAVTAGIGAYFVWRGYHPDHAPGVARVTSLAPFVGPRDGSIAAGLVVGGAF